MKLTYQLHNLDSKPLSEKVALVVVVEGTYAQVAAVLDEVRMSFTEIEGEVR